MNLPEPLEILRAALADRYRIDEEIGRGGMATVYLAEDLKHGRQVAIKALRPDLLRGYEPERFLREIRIAARLNHPQILPLHDSGMVEYAPGMPGPYYVMPYMGCESLRDRLRREKQLPIDATLRITRGVAAALDYAHRQNVLHRDIKPENIMLHEGEPVVADFGVARAISVASETHVTDPGMAIGTPAYMSPEQASADRDLDRRSDLYSLACVVYEMLAGQPPFSGLNSRATMARHAVDPVPSLRALRANVPASMEQAILKALAKEPAERFATTAEFAEALVTPGPVLADIGFRSAGAGRTRAIAVLPFVNASPDPENEYFSDGMTDELINALAQVEGLRVASRTSVFALKGKPQDIRDIGAALDVSAVLEGAVRRSGQRLRITVQLTSVADGRHLWSERYDRDAQDLFAVQDEIAGRIVGTLRTNLLGDLGDATPKRYTENLRAYHLYLKGRYCWNQRTRDGIDEAIEYFEQAIAEDPAYALAYTGLADCHALHVDYRGAPVGEGMRRAKAEALKALELDDTLAEAHTSLGWVLFIYDWDWIAAGREFRRAIEVNARYGTAHQWYSWFLIAMGRVDEALDEGRVAVELDPTSLSIRRSLGWLHYYSRQPEAALEHLNRALAMNPTSEETHFILGFVYTQKRMYREAVTSFRESVALSSEHARAIAGLGHVAALEGRLDDARQVLADLYARARERYVSPVDFVTLHADLGELDQAFDWLERARKERRGWLSYLKVEPGMDGLRGDPRFGEFLKKMNLE
ncbi:MAG: protein kinase domain-containing protein [Gemmatimonadales bacterium]